MDRNKETMSILLKILASPSSRRAWIEIGLLRGNHYRLSVALLAEGVDRNVPVLLPVVVASVALLAEGVDRNK